LNFVIDNCARETFIPQASTELQLSNFQNIVVRRGDQRRDAGRMSFDCQVFVEICDTRSSPSALFGAGNGSVVLIASITCSYAFSRR